MPLGLGTGLGAQRGGRDEPLTELVGSWVRGGERLASSQPQLNSLGKQQHWEHCWQSTAASKGLRDRGWCGPRARRQASPLPGALAFLGTQQAASFQGKEGLGFRPRRPVLRVASGGWSGGQPDLQPSLLAW